MYLLCRVVNKLDLIVGPLCSATTFGSSYTFRWLRVCQMRLSFASFFFIVTPLRDNACSRPCSPYNNGRVVCVFPFYRESGYFLVCFGKICIYLIYSFVFLSCRKEALSVAYTSKSFHSKKKISNEIHT